MTMVDAPPAEPARHEAEFDFLDRKVVLLEPSDGQKLILIHVLGLSDESADTSERIEIILNFSTMLRSLFVQDADRSFVLGTLARNAADLEDYIDLARQMAERWEVGEDEATNREERRTRERRPAQAVRTRRR